MDYMVYMPRADQQMQGSVIWCHGGCFTDGDETWDNVIAKYLSSCGFRVVTSNFRQGPDNPWPAATDDILRLCAHSKLMYPQLPVHVGGASSGGFFAYDAACKLPHSKCVLLCPVLDAYRRYLYLPDSNPQKYKQLAYFGTEELMRSITKHVYEDQRPRSLHIITGGVDVDAPSNICCSREAALTIAGADHSLCSEPPPVVLVSIKQYLLCTT